jgi:hypothetical protein
MVAGGMAVTRNLKFEIGDFKAGLFKVLVPNLHFQNFDEGNHLVGGGVVMEHLQVEFGGGDACDSSAREITASRFDVNDHVFLRFTRNNAEEPGQLGLKETAIEGKIAAPEDDGFRQDGRWILC